MPDPADAPDWQPWLKFFLRALHQQMKRLAAKVERKKLVVAALAELSVQIVDHARHHGRVTIGVSRNTLKEHFRKLVENGHLARHGTGKGSWYALP